jgi:hypothetical protein
MFRFVYDEKGACAGICLNWSMLQNETPVISYFIRGGQPLATTAPTGDFILNAASDHWYGESSLFGGDTSIVETGRTICTISLQPRPNGNLPLQNTGRANF